jgi:leucyl/phenylalanyl-tRNA--protein transferase
VSRLPYPLGPEPDAPFPAAHLALREPNGLLAVGGDLSPGRLIRAYRSGIFPWYSTGQPILWWSPDPRMVFDSNRFSLSSRFRRSLRASDWTVRADTVFPAVIRACAEAYRPGQFSTWILPEMEAAYLELHRLGHAHSIEVFAGEELIGGIYGVALGRMFFGESMFSRRSGGSKLALGALLALMRDWSWPLLDAQLENPHLRSLGGLEMARPEFLVRVQALVALEGRPGTWAKAFGERPAAAYA